MIGVKSTLEKIKVKIQEEDGIRKLQPLGLVIAIQGFLTTDLGSILVHDLSTWVTNNAIYFP